jgi:hypothetical protein
MEGAYLKNNGIIWSYVYRLFQPEEQILRTKMKGSGIITALFGSLYIILFSLDNKCSGPKRLGVFFRAFRPRANPGPELASNTDTTGHVISVCVHHGFNGNAHALACNRIWSPRLGRSLIDN